MSSKVKQIRICRACHDIIQLLGKPHKLDTHSNCMKLSIGIFIAAIIVSAGIWLADIANDQSKAIKISENVPAYNDWECGYQLQAGCTKVFEVAPVQIFQVERIRYGKDFMAVKISDGGRFGWVISGTGVEVYAQPNT